VIVNELVLNAMKYAYPEDKGPIRIGLKRVNGKRAMLSVEDDGIGHDIKMLPRSTGLGRSIVGAMATRLGANVIYDPAHSGTRVVITFECGAPASA
jgi:two-component sensor histidine kinase